MVASAVRRRVRLDDVAGARQHQHVLRVDRKTASLPAAARSVRRSFASSTATLCAAAELLELLLEALEERERVGGRASETGHDQVAVAAADFRAVLHLPVEPAHLTVARDADVSRRASAGMVVAWMTGRSASRPHVLCLQVGPGLVDAGAALPPGSGARVELYDTHCAAARGSRACSAAWSTGSRAEQLLDRAQVGAVVEQVRGAAVAQRVRIDLSDARGRIARATIRPTLRTSSRVPRETEGRPARVRRPAVAHVREACSAARGLRQRHDAVLAAFARADVRCCWPRDVSPVRPDRLAGAQLLPYRISSSAASPATHAVSDRPVLEHVLGRPRRRSRAGCDGSARCRAAAGSSAIAPVRFRCAKNDRRTAMVRPSERRATSAAGSARKRQAVEVHVVPRDGRAAEGRTPTAQALRSRRRAGCAATRDARRAGAQVAGRPDPRRDAAARIRRLTSVRHCRSSSRAGRPAPAGARLYRPDGLCYHRTRWPTPTVAPRHRCGAPLAPDRPSRRDACAACNADVRACPKLRLPRAGDARRLPRARGRARDRQGARTSAVLRVRHGERAPLRGGERATVHAPLDALFAGRERAVIAAALLLSCTLAGCVRRSRARQPSASSTAITWRSISARAGEAVGLAREGRGEIKHPRRRPAGGESSRPRCTTASSSSGAGRDRRWLHLRADDQLRSRGSCSARRSSPWASRTARRHAVNFQEID